MSAVAVVFHLTGVDGNITAGRIFCDSCTSQRALLNPHDIVYRSDREHLPTNFHNPQRVCDACYARMLSNQDSLRLVNSNAVQETFLAEGGSRWLTMNSPYSYTMRDEIRKAAYSVQNFTLQGVIKDSYIPLSIIASAKGLAFLSVVKAGIIFSARIGTGLVIAKLANGQWSAPSSIGTAGIGWGPQIGAEIADIVVVLNTSHAVEIFSSAGQVTLGAELSVAAGPIGRVASGSVNTSYETTVPCYSYSHSKGLFVGFSLEGSVIVPRHDINQSFYGRAIPVGDLLNGVEPFPLAAKPLHDALQAALTTSGT